MVGHKDSKLNILPMTSVTLLAMDKQYYMVALDKYPTLE
jgi:hypothetical protein